jgi:FkbM family methyltransferase
MKSRAKRVLHRLFGFHTYLIVHAIFVAMTLRFRRQEGAVMEFIRRLPTNATVLDIGTNVGSMSLLFAWKARTGQVIGFEPIPENYRAASGLLAFFGVKNARLHPFGLGERDENVQMVMPNDRHGVRLEGLSHVVDANRAAGAGTTYTVPLRRLDEVLKSTKVDAIKIDVEDHERFVLRGGMHVIERDRPMIYAELASADNRAECLRVLSEFGYRTVTPAGNVNVLFLPAGMS